ncbi:hypothetical protein BDV12DRAFT_150068 [Aspergillus spectabilis]
MKPHNLFPPEEWRNLYRSLLRECSYLPDPIARSASHDHVRQRFRRYHQERRTHIRNDIVRLGELHRQARYSLSVLKRANQGYTRPLEKVLRFAYGRNGRRRREMLEKLLAVDIPQDQSMVEALLSAPVQYSDDWKPPQIVIDLLKSQNNQPAVTQISERIPVKETEPPVGGTTAWGRKIPLKRRVNIRRRWFNSVMDALLPPLPEAELEVLEGLLSGELAWNPPKRRAKQHIASSSSSSAASKVAPRGEMVRKILTAGPQKDDTFRPYIDGRPHNITRRFMRRLWQRISCLVPRQRWDALNGKYRFDWDAMKTSPTVAFGAKEETSQDIFRGVDFPKRPHTPRRINPDYHPKALE